METKNIAQTVIENCLQPNVVDFEGYRPFIISPSGSQLLSLDVALEKPREISADPEFDNITGFIQYVRDYKSDATVIFASRRALKAVFDYHTKEQPSWCNHCAKARLETTPEWRGWIENDRSQFTHQDFADFLEEQLDTIEEPSGGSLLTVIKEFRAFVRYESVQVVNDNGALATVEFKKNVQSKGQGEVELPRELKIVLQPYKQFDAAVRFKVRLNYSVSNDASKIAFSYSIVNREKGEDMVFEKVVDEVRIRTEARVYGGA